jgi:hypothetical protein
LIAPNHKSKSEIANLKNWETDYARDRYVTVRRLQRAELLDHQEQEDHDWAVGVQEVLQAVPQAYRA